MKFIAEYRSYLQKLQNDEIDHGDIFPRKVAKIMAKIRLWYDSEDYAKLSKKGVALNIFLLALAPIIWMNLLVYLYLYIGDLSMLEMGENVAFCMGGNIAFYRNVDFFRRRALLSEVIDETNRMSQDLVYHPQYGAKYLHKRNRIHYYETIVTVPLVIGGLLNGLPPNVVAIVTGKLFLFTATAVDPEPYGWSFMFEYFLQVAGLVTSGIYYTLYEVMLVGIYVQLIFAYQMINEEFQELRPVDKPFDEEEEYQKLINCLQRLQNLEQLVNKMNEFASMYLVIIYSLFYLLIALACFIILTQLEEGLSTVIKSLFYPSYCFIIIVFWSYLGQFLIDQTNILDESLYNGNWMDAPPKYRRLILIFMIKCQHTIELDAKPFYVINSEALSNFVKQIYYTVTLLKNFYA